MTFRFFGPPPVRIQLPTGPELKNGKITDREKAHSRLQSMFQKSALLLIPFFLYFLSFITGRPAYFEPGPSAPLSEEPGVAFESGLLGRLVLESRFLSVMSDPLLESDARPSEVFRAVERSAVADRFYLVVSAFWCVLLMFCFLAGARGYWFYRPMLQVILGPSIAILLAILLVARSKALSTNFTVTLYNNVIPETILLAIGIGMFLYQKMRLDPVSGGRSFLDFLQKRGTVQTQRISGGFTVAMQLILITLTGATISNLLLLPLYKLQLSFPGYFGILLIAALIALGIFYLYSYSKVSAMAGEEKSLLAPPAFLGFRILSNTVFLTLLIGAITVVIGTIVSLAILNIDLLQGTGILQPVKGL